jgi:endonuclease YncB( thermonuclease family)
MSRSRTRRRFLGLLCLAVGLAPAFAGDSLYGTVKTVKTGVLVTFNYGHGQYDIRLIGIDMPAHGLIATRARDFVAHLVLDKKARIRFEHRVRTGEMLARLFTAEPAIGIGDVGLELVRAGLARRQPNYDYKYGELAAAEKEARTAKRGLWAPP